MDLHTDAAEYEQLVIGLSSCCQACLGRNEPHSCAPSTMNDTREPERYGRFLVQANPERTEDGHRQFVISTVTRPNIKVIRALSIDVNLIDSLAILAREVDVDEDLTVIGRSLYSE